MQVQHSIRVFFVAGVLLPACYGQGSSSNGDQAPLPRISIAASIGTLGAGIQAGTAVMRRLNVRGGFNYFSYSLSGANNDGLSYDGSLRLSSGEALVDFFPVRWLHLSGGALLYNGFRGKGDITEPGGRSFKLNGVNYYSSTADPVTGTGKIVARSAAPMVLFGFGNLLPRNRHHFTAYSDFGVAFQGAPTTTLNLVGSTCATPTTGCAPISSQPSVQANVTAEQTKINKDLKPFNFYPVMRISFGWKVK